MTCASAFSPSSQSYLLPALYRCQSSNPTLATITSYAGYTDDPCALVILFVTRSSGAVELAVANLTVSSSP